jgi:hypothetical protein
MRPLLLLLLPAAVLAVSGCKSIDAKAHNLRQLHDSEGWAREDAKTLSDVEYLTRSGLTGLSGGRMTVKADDGKEVKNPWKTSFKTLRQLAEFDPDSGDNLYVQAEMFSWLGPDADFVLSRETAILGLVNVAPRLDVEGPLPPHGGGPANAEEVVAALQHLISISAPVLAGKANPAEAAAFREACMGLRRLKVDRDSGRRTLSVCTLLLRRARRGSEKDVAPLESLRDEVARWCVSRALFEALRDEEPVVRIASLRLAAALSPEARIAALSSAISVDYGDPEADVRVASLDLIAAGGLPSEEDWPDVPGLPDRETVMGTIVGSLESIYGRERAAASRCLGVVSGSDLSTLRSEEWTAWWRERTAHDRGVAQ